MPLTDFAPVLRYAREHSFAVGAFNPVDYLSSRAIVRTAQKLDAPVILQTSAKTVRYYGPRAIANWIEELCRDTEVPVSLHLDHGKDLGMIQDCLAHGWTNVMIDASDLPFEQNLARSQAVFEMAKKMGATIEAEIGEIHGVEEDIVVEGPGATVDPSKAKAFCEAMDLGVFAPAIGTAHGVYKGEPKIDWDTLETLHRTIDTPLALHGGTGLEDAIIQRCIKLGCSKINISTNLKHAFIDSFIDYRQTHPDAYEPLAYIGAQEDAICDIVSRKIQQFGGQGTGAAIAQILG